MPYTGSMSDASASIRGNNAALAQLMMSLLTTSPKAAPAADAAPDSWNSPTGWTTALPAAGGGTSYGNAFPLTGMGGAATPTAAFAVQTPGQPLLQNSGYRAGQYGALGAQGSSY